MPELPEVETIVRGLRACLPGRRIVGVELGQPRVLRTPAAELAGALEGAWVLGVERHGKHILFRMGRPGGKRSGRKRPSRDDFWFIVHLGMTGQLVCEPATREPRPHTHATFVLEGGAEELRYTDPRQFGRLEIAAGSGFSASSGFSAAAGGAGARLPPRLERLGPDPLMIEEGEFVRLLRGRRARVKALLLDQHFLRGLGNIYADESLFRAGVRPAAIGSRISRPRAAALWHAMRSVLEEAIAHGGSSVSDYLDAGGRPGSFQDMHRVYGRAGEPCLSCGAVLRRALVAGRGTTFCPRCQKGN